MFLLWGHLRVGAFKHLLNCSCLLIKYIITIIIFQSLFTSMVKKFDHPSIIILKKTAGTEPISAVYTLDRSHPITG